MFASQLGDRMSPEFRVMMDGVKAIKYGGEQPPRKGNIYYYKLNFYHLNQGHVIERY